MSGTSSEHDREVLEVRARDLAQPHGREIEEDQHPLLVATVGTTRLAFDLGQVRQVLEPAPIARLPAGDHAVVGLRNVAGELLAVAHMAALLGTRSDLAAHASHVIVVDGHEPLGILVDSVDGVVAGQTPTSRPAHPDTANVVAGATPDGHLLIDAEALLTHAASRVRPGRTHENVHQEEAK